MRYVGSSPEDRSSVRTCATISTYSERLDASSIAQPASPRAARKPSADLSTANSGACSPSAPKSESDGYVASSDAGIRTGRRIPAFSGGAADTPSTFSWNVWRSYTNCASVRPLSGAPGTCAPRSSSAEVSGAASGSSRLNTASSRNSPLSGKPVTFRLMAAVSRSALHAIGATAQCQARHSAENARGPTAGRGRRERSSPADRIRYSECALPSNCRADLSHGWSHERLVPPDVRVPPAPARGTSHHRRSAAWCHHVVLAALPC